ncbi:GAF domain-containing protein, partial [Streptomyces zhihengii]
MTGGEPVPPGAPDLSGVLAAVIGVGGEIELRPALQRIVDTAASLTGARYAALGVLDPEHRRITELFTHGPTGPEPDRTGEPPGGPAGLIGELLRDPRPPAPEDPAGDPRSPGVPGGPPRTHTFLGVPVRVGGEVFGHLYLTERRGGPFDDEDLALVTVLASQAGIAVGNARLYETARRRERWIEGAAAVTTALLSGRSADDALTTVAEQARILAGAAAGVVLQPTEEGGMEIVAASTRDDPEGLVGTTILPGSPVLVQLLGGEPVFIEDS